jgi:tetracycline repressor-like protein
LPYGFTWAKRVGNAAIVSQFHSGGFYPQRHTRETLLSQDAPPEMIATYRHLKEVWKRLNSIFQSRDGPLIMRRVHNSNAQAIEGNLRAAFGELDSRIAYDLLANYLAGGQIAFLQWWLEQSVPYSPEDIAQTFHRLQRAAIRDAFGLLDRN